MDNTAQKKNREQSFVDYVLVRLKNDNAFGAALRRANNPSTEYQSWEHLASWCDLDKEWELRPYSTIAAAIAHAKPDKDGFVGIGKALSLCYDDGNQSDSAKSKLRRLLACDSVAEVCSLLRPLLRLVHSHSVSLSYGKLLNELVYFGENIKVKWAIDFYGRRKNDSLSA